MPLTEEELQQLKDKVEVLVSDKADTKVKSQDRQEKSAIADKANEDFHLSALAEQVAVAKEATDLQDLKSFVESLTA